MTHFPIVYICFWLPFSLHHQILLCSIFIMEWTPLPKSRGRYLKITTLLSAENETYFQYNISIIMSVKVQFINTINNYKEDTIGVNPTLAQLWSCIEPSLAFATRTTSKHQRFTWPGLYGKLIEFLCIVVRHMRVSSRLQGVMWLECD